MTGEQRRSVRKSLSADGILSVDGAQHRIRTIDVSAGELSIAMAKQLTVRRNCHVQFALEVQGKRMSLRRAAMSSIVFTLATEPIAQGLQFLSIALDGGNLIDQFIAAESSVPK
jgi:hypothetical protein